MKHKFAAFIAVVIILFSSCSNLSDDPTLNIPSSIHNATLTGSINFSGAMPEEMANRLNLLTYQRTAFPSIPASVTPYAIVTASGHTWGGTANFDNYPAYSITGLETGVEWSIEIGIKDGSSIILKDIHVLTETTKLTNENPVYNHDFELKPFQTAENTTLGIPAGKGNIGLTIEIESGCGITKCVTSIDSTPLTFSGTEITLTVANLISRVYNVDFTFYNNSNEVLYSFTEAVNIFDNMTTNTWVRSGGTGSSAYLVSDGSGGIKCYISKALVDSYKMTIFYVAPVASGGHNIHSGTFFSPLATIEGAAAKMNDSNIDYTIYVIGSVQGVFSLPSSLNTKVKSIKIKGYNGLDTSGNPKDKLYGCISDFGSVYDFLDAKNDNTAAYQNCVSEGKIGRVLTISTSKPVIIENLEFSDGAEGGIKLNTGADVTIKNCLVKNCFSPDRGGGIEVNGAAVKMSGGKITGNKSWTSSGTNEQGGGVVIYNGGSFELSGGEISSNYCRGSGGAVYIGNRGESGTNSFVMSGGFIYDNYTLDTSHNYGGVVKANSADRVSLTGGKIYNNYYVNGSYKYYGGIYAAGEIEIGGTAWILYNETDYITADSIKITGALTTQTGSNGIVAAIKPFSYTEGVQILTLASSPNPPTSFTREYSKFTVLPVGTDNYGISREGKLEAIQLITSATLADFNPTSGSYNIRVDSSFTSANLSTLSSKLDGHSSNSVLDLSNANITSLNQQIRGGISRLVLPTKLTSLNGYPTWLYTNALKEVCISEENENFVTEDGVLYNKTKTKLCCYPTSKAGASFEMPDTVIELGSLAFKYNKNLVSITGLDRIQSAGEQALSACEKLEVADLSGWGNALPYGLFLSSKIKEVTLSENVNAFGSFAFQNCSQLIKVTFKSSTPPVLSSASAPESIPTQYQIFQGSSVTDFYVPSGSKDAYLAATGDKGFANPNYNAKAANADFSDHVIEY